MVEFLAYVNYHVFTGHTLQNCNDRAVRFEKSSLDGRADVGILRPPLVIGGLVPRPYMGEFSIAAGSAMNPAPQAAFGQLRLDVLAAIGAAGPRVRSHRPRNGDAPRHHRP